MKFKKNWKRIIAGLMAATMVFLSIDGGCISALAAEIQEQNNEQEFAGNFPTGGLMPLKGMEVSQSDFNRVNSEIKLSSVQAIDEEVYDWEKYSTKYLYNQLSPEWKDIWDDMDERCILYMNTNIDGVVSYNYFDQKDYYFTTAIPIEHDITSSDFYTLYTLFLASNPQYYFLGYSGFEYVYADDDDFIDSVGLGMYQAFLDGDTRATNTATLKAAIEAAYTDLPESASEEEILKHLHDYIINNVEYNYDILKDDNAITNEEEALSFTQTVYSALCMDTTVCAGYAESLQMLCNGFGVDALIVTSVDHMWNKVRINDSWYNVDATWADAGSDNPIYYDYYARNDAIYDDTSDPQYLSHQEEAVWASYLPLCTLDTTPKDDGVTPGDFPVISEQVAAPELIIMEAGTNEDTGEKCYMVGVKAPTFVDVSNPIQYYYTVDGTEPSVASSKAIKYTDSFFVEGEYTIKMIAAQNGYLDSEVAVYTNVVDVPSVKNPVINDHFYNKMTLQWDALEEVTGYVLNIYQGEERLAENIIKTVTIENNETNTYVLDTSSLEAGTTIFYEIYAYIGEDSEHVSEVACSQKYKTKDEAIDVGVKWHVTTIDGVEYLVIDVTENLVGDQTPSDALWLWYYSDASEINPKRAFKVDMSDGVTYFMYKEGEYDISYKEIGYIFVTNEDKSSAFQENGFKVGGDYVEPQIEAIPDVKLEEKDQQVTLKAQIKQETQMENFFYTYQWYVAEDESSMGSAIDGATKNTLTISPGSFEEKFYYCEIIVEYPVDDVVKQIFLTDNGVESESGEKGHTRVLGELYGTDLDVADIPNQVYTGNEINPEIYATDKQTGEVLIQGEDYEVVFTNNLNVGEVVGLVTFKGDYVEAPAATVKFNIVPKSVKDAEDILVFSVEDKIYTGEAFEPKGEITDTTRNEKLVEGIDYILHYYSNINAGTANVTIEFIGNYCDEKYIIFKINPKSCEGVVISNNVSQTYAGFAIEPTFLVVKDGEKTLAYKTDYIFECSNNTNVGDATVKVVFIGNYKGELSTQFSITQKYADDLIIDTIADCEYTGSAITPGLTIVYVNGTSSVVLHENTDYTAKYEQNISCGTATVKLEFGGNYTGNREVTFNIIPKKAENLTYETLPEFTYDGTAYEPELVIKNGNITLVKGVDYEVQYADNINAGAAKAIVTFNGFEGCSGNYTGTKELTFQINPKTAEGNCTVTLQTLDDYTFTGSEIKPGVIVEDGETVLKENTEEVKGDYTVEYIDNINAGEAKVKITFVNNYEGEATLTFDILRKPITEEDIEVEEIAYQTYIGKPIIPENIVVKEKNSNVVLRRDQDYTVTLASENTYVGTGKVIISLDLEGNYIYTGEDIEVEFQIKPRDASNVVIEDIPNQTYTGSEITPTLVVTDEDIVLVAGVDYAVEYENNIEVGTEAKVTINFMGNFTGESKIAYFTIIDPIPEYITSSVFTVSENNKYISKITVGTTAYTLRINVNESDYVNIFDKNSNMVSGETVLATGMMAGIVDEGTVVKGYAIIVTGDTNGDGKINITDMIAVKACTLKKSGLSGAYEKAGDVNGDGKINITDFIKVKATTLKKDTIVGVSVN